MSTLSITDMLAMPTAPTSNNQESAPVDAAAAFLSVLDQQLGLLLGTGLVGRGQDQATGTVPETAPETGRADPLQYKPGTPFPIMPEVVPSAETLIPTETVLLEGAVAEIIPEDITLTDMAVFGEIEAAAPETAEATPEVPTEAGVAAAAIAILLAAPPPTPIAAPTPSITADELALDADAAAKPLLEIQAKIPADEAADTAPEQTGTKTAAPKQSHIADSDTQEPQPEATAKDLAALRDTRTEALRDARTEQRLAALKGQTQPTTTGTEQVVIAQASPRPAPHATGFQPLSFAQAAQGTFQTTSEPQGETPDGDSSQQGFSSFLASFDPGTTGKNAATAATGANNQGFLSYLTSARPGFGAPPAGEQILMSIRQMAQQKQTELTVQLQPAELGKINIRLEFAEGGKVKARVAADRAETLDLLQSDRRGLEQALAAAGFDLDAGGMEFSLQQGNQQSFGNRESSGAAIAAGQNLPVDSLSPESDTADAVLVDLSNGVVNVKI